MSAEHSNKISIDDACDEIASLQLDTDSDFSRFCAVAIRYLIPVVRTNHKVELLSLWPEKEIADFIRLVLSSHPGIPLDNAFIVATHAIEHEVFKYVKSRTDA